MGLEQATVREIVEKAVTHRWGIPEFQRGFVWTPQKVRDLIGSRGRGYPGAGQGGMKGKVDS